MSFLTAVRYRVECSSSIPSARVAYSPFVMSNATSRRSRVATCPGLAFWLRGIEVRPTKRLEGKWSPRWVHGWQYLKPNYHHEDETYAVMPQAHLVLWRVHPTFHQGHLLVNGPPCMRLCGVSVTKASTCASMSSKDSKTDNANPSRH